MLVFAQLFVLLRLHTCICMHHTAVALKPANIYARTFDCIDRTNFQEMYIFYMIVQRFRGTLLKEQTARKVNRDNHVVQTYKYYKYHLLATSRFHVTLICISDKITSDKISKYSSRARDNIKTCKCRQHVFSMIIRCLFFFRVIDRFLSLCLCYNVIQLWRAINNRSLLRKNNNVRL